MIFWATGGGAEVLGARKPAEGSSGWDPGTCPSRDQGERGRKWMLPGTSQIYIYTLNFSDVDYVMIL